MAEILEESRNIQLHDYLSLVGVVVLFYDHLITFDKEVQHIWSQPAWTKSAFFFFANRYIGLLINMAHLVLSHLRSLDYGQCHAWSVSRELMLIACQLLICFVVSLRTYALFQCSRKMGWFLLIFAFILVALSTWAMTGQTGIRSEFVNPCRMSLHRTSAIRLAVTWEALFVYDTTLFALTLYKTWQSRSFTSLATVGSVPLLGLLLRDGAVYFMLMALVNLPNIITFYIAPHFLRGSLSTFASSLSITLVSRMMLNLHSVAASGVLSTISGLMFADPDETGGQLDSMVEVTLPFPVQSTTTTRSRSQRETRETSSARTIFMARP